MLGNASQFGAGENVILSEIRGVTVLHIIVFYVQWSIIALFKISACKIGE